MKPQTDKEIAMKCMRGLTRVAVLFAFVTLVLATACSAGAPGASVRGHGKVLLDDGLSPGEISVDAWIDDEGVAHGTIAFIGDIAFQHPGGPADAWIIQVYEIDFFGNSAGMAGIIVHSVFPEDIGQVVPFLFTDNGGTGEPDEIYGVPIVAGNITVTD